MPEGNILQGPTVKSRLSSLRSSIFLGLNKGTIAFELSIRAILLFTFSSINRLTLR